MLGIAVLIGCQENTAIADMTKNDAAVVADNSTPTSTPAPAPSDDPKKYKSAGDVPRISVEDAKKAYDAGTAVFVDSRAEAAYKVEHIAGAINIPNGPDAADKFSSLPKGKKVIVYCS